MEHFILINDDNEGCQYISLDKATVSQLLDNLEPKEDAERIRSLLPQDILIHNIYDGYHTPPMEFQEAIRYCLKTLGINENTLVHVFK